MSSVSTVSSTEYALLARQHKARTSAAPQTVADTNIAAGNRSTSIGLDSTGNAIMQKDHTHSDKDKSGTRSAAINLFG